MSVKKILNALKSILTLILTLIFIFFLFGKNIALADKNSGPERIRECSASGELEGHVPAHPPGQLYKDMQFDLSNPTCLGVALQAYISTKLAIKSVDLMCNNSVVPPSPLPTPYQDFLVLWKGYKKVSNPKCKNSFGGFAGAFGASLATWSGIISTAKINYNDVKVCGHDWYGPDPDNYRYDAEGSYQKLIRQKKDNSPNSSYEQDKFYREWFHQGKEFSDNVRDEETCIDPDTGKPQRYYFRGLQQADFLCEKYNPALKNDKDKNDKYKKAYECCLKRRQNYICLEKKLIPDHIFCKAGQKCSFKTNTSVSFEAYRRENNRLICARSYSLCPFNFAVGGGTVYPDFYKDGIMTSDGKYRSFRGIPTEDDIDYSSKTCDEKSEVRNSDCSFNSKNGKMKNYCQYYTHCTVVSPVSFKPDFKNLSPYFSIACINSIGDSQNVQKSNSYNPGLGLGSQNNFSAPIVQCVKETMENIFKNTAGHSKCNDGSFGDLNNICADDSYANISPIGNLVWKKGNKVKENSLFETLQKRLKNIVTLFLVLSVTFFGAKILILKVDIANKKEILTYILKIGLIIYFVNGNAWRDIFFDGIYKGSSEISRIFFKINTIEENRFKNDDFSKISHKCNFGSLYDDQGNKVKSTRIYPPEKDYLLIWDTLDCKIMQYLNYGPSFSSGSIFALIIASFFTGGIGLFMAFSVFILAFSLIATVIRAMHIFISSSVAIIIYVFISPIIIPLMLFEKTKSIFDAWLSQLFLFALQPIILFSFLAIFITLSEKILYKDAVFDDRGGLVCAPHCRDANNKIIEDIKICKGNDSSNYSDVIEPNEVTPACIMRIKDFKHNNGFAAFGIFLPTLFNLNNNKILIILKCALFLYVLLRMIDQIPDITSDLIGENIDVKSADGIEMLKKFTAGVRSIQKRAARAAQLNIPSGKEDDKDESEASDSASEIFSPQDSAGSSSSGSDSAGSSSSGSDSAGRNIQ